MNVIIITKSVINLCEIKIMFNIFKKEDNGSTYPLMPTKLILAVSFSKGSISNFDKEPFVTGWARYSSHATTTLVAGRLSRGGHRGPQKLSLIHI